MLRGEQREFGELLGEAWKQKKRMSPLVSTARIDELYDLEMRNDALGGKVTGAGGSGSIAVLWRLPPEAPRHHGV